MSLPVVALLCTALVIRLALLPLWAGYDLHADLIMARLALHGHDVYGLTPAFLRAHHLSPWTYFPLCLDMYTALAWLGAHTGWSILVLGKLPVVAADLGVGGLLYTALRHRGHAAHAALAGMALYLFNPLVLYNGAFYGRFDAISLAFLLLPLERYHTRWFAPAYALAVAAKTFPLFALPLLLLGRERQKPPRLALAAGIVVVLALPAVVVDARGLLSYLLANTSGAVSFKGLGRLSWYSILWDNRWASMGQILVLARMATLLFPVALLAVVHRPLYVKMAACFILFLLLSRTVYEQYLIWPLPFLIIIALHHRGRLAFWLIGLYTVAGALENEYTWTSYHGHLPRTLVPTPWPALNAVLVASGLTFLAVECGRQCVPHTTTPRALWAEPLGHARVRFAGVGRHAAPRLLELATRRETLVEPEKARVASPYGGEASRVSMTVKAASDR